MNFLTIQQASEKLGMNAGHVRRLCASGRLPGATQIAGQWRIPSTAHAKLRGYTSPDQVVDMTDIPVNKRDEAIRRRGLIEECERFCAAAVANNICRLTAMNQFCTQRGIPMRTMQRWMANLKERGISGLIDKRGATTTSEIISPEAWTEFLREYLDPRQRSVKSCLLNVAYKSQAEKLNWIIPTLRTMQRYVTDKIPIPVLTLHREGMAAYEAKCAPHILIDQYSVEPGAVWVGDHHQFDCWIRHRGDWVRPWITAWEDYRSRKIVGWYVSVAPNSTTILLAMRRGVEQFGPPESVKIDNGKDYDSQTFTGTTKAQRRRLNKDEQENIAGLYAMLNIGVSFAIPYNAKAKKIERWFDTLDCQFTKTIETYCGKDTARRPEELAELMKTDAVKSRAMTLESFSAIVEKYITIYNTSAHTGDGMNGQSPDQVFATRTSRRVIDRDLLDMLARIWSPELKVGKNGVKFKGFWYGQYNAPLLSMFGKPVRVAYNPDDIGRVDVYDANYRYITTAEQASLIQYGKIDERAVREAMALKSRAVRVVRQARPAARVSAMSLTDLTLKAMAESTQETPIAAPVNVKLVKTPLDGQAKEYLRQRNQIAIRKAAGAENTTSIQSLTFDLSPIMLSEQRPRLTFCDESKNEHKPIKLTYEE